MLQILPPTDLSSVSEAPAPQVSAAEHAPKARSILTVTPSFLALVGGSVLAFVVAPWPLAMALVATVWGALFLIDRLVDAPAYPLDVNQPVAPQAQAAPSLVATFAPPSVDPFHEEKLARQDQRPTGPIDLPDTTTPLRLVRDELFGKPAAAHPLPVADAPLPPHPISLSAILLPDQSTLTQTSEHQAAYRGARVPDWKAFAATSA